MLTQSEVDSTAPITQPSSFLDRLSDMILDKLFKRLDDLKKLHEVNCVMGAHEFREINSLTTCIHCGLTKELENDRNWRQSLGGGVFGGAYQTYGSHTHNISASQIPQLAPLPRDSSMSELLEKMEQSRKDMTKYLESQFAPAKGAKITGIKEDPYAPKF